MTETKTRNLKRTKSKSSDGTCDAVQKEPVVKKHKKKDRKVDEKSCDSTSEDEPIVKKHKKKKGRKVDVKACDSASGDEPVVKKHKKKKDSKVDEKPWDSTSEDEPVVEKHKKKKDLKLKVDDKLCDSTSKNDNDKKPDDEESKTVDRADFHYGKKMSDGHEKNKSEEKNEPNDIDDKPSGEEEDEMEGPRDIGGFTVLGEFKAKEKHKVKRILPKWLRSPTIIQSKADHKFADIQWLDPSLIARLEAENITKCFPVQWTVIPQLLAQCRCGLYAGDAGFRSRDICVSAPTGSGKTLTFALPIIQALTPRVVPHVRALVVLPVRDLALQVYRVFQQYSQHTSLKVVLLAGKKDFQSEQKSLVRERENSDIDNRWNSTADIVVATKGRLLDHIDQTEGFDLSHLRFFVIDEADRQMEDIYDDWLRQVETAVYSPKIGASGTYYRKRPGPYSVAGSKQVVMHPQKLLFSATLSQNPEKLEQLSLFMPKLFSYHGPGNKMGKEEIKDDKNNDVTEESLLTSAAQANDMFSAPVLLKEKYLDCKAAEKPLVLLHFVINQQFENVLCFANTVESAHRLFLLAKQMDGVRAAELSSNVHTQKRERVIRKFEKGDFNLLICSDVMTRGMDIENVKYVVSYEAPAYIETYIHRVGRTARAHKAGTAITLLEGKEVYHFKTMMRESGRWNRLKRINVKPTKMEKLLPQFNEALRKLPEILKEQKRQKKAS